MRILIAPQEFKGSLTAVEAAAAIADGIRAVFPDAEIIELPMSDGGPGLLDVMLTTTRGRRIEATCSDPLMQPIRASFGVLKGSTAVIEMAAASGLVLIRPEERDPRVATTYGTGELIRAALDHNPSEIIVGVGGSATVDGGAGAIQALGVRLINADDQDVQPGGAPLAGLARIDAAGLDPRLRATRLRVACDVTNPLVGKEGAAVVFGPQKGASPEVVRILEAALRHFAEVLMRETGVDVASIPGGGAAGGLPAALVAVAAATIEPGFDLVAEVTGLEAQIAAADIVITGEGRLDSQTASGKTVSGVARMARAHARPVGVIAGHIDASYTAIGEFDAVQELRREGMTTEDAMASAGGLMAGAAKRIVEQLAARTKD